MNRFSSPSRRNGSPEFRPVAGMERDAAHCVGLGSTARKQAINAYNALTDKIDEAYGIFSMDRYADQIRTRYMDIINSSGQFAATLYTSLANSKSRASGKLEALATLQQKQQETAMALAHFVAMQDKGKDPVRPDPPSDNSSTTARGSREMIPYPTNPVDGCQRNVSLRSFAVS